MTETWQSIAALGIVALTAGIFLWKILRRNKSRCGNACHCAKGK